MKVRNNLYVYNMVTSCTQSWMVCQCSLPCMKVVFSESLAVLSTLEKFVLGVVKKVSLKFIDFIFFYHVITAYVLKHVYY